MAAVAALLLSGRLFASPTVMTSGPVLVAVAHVEQRRHRERHRRRERSRGLPMVVDEVIQQLRSGHSLRQSCRRLEELNVGSSLESLSPMFDALRARRTLAEAAASLLDQPDHSVRLLGVTLQVLAVNGGPAVPALQRLRHTLIGAVHGEQRADAQSSQAMASATMLAVSPLLFALGLATMDARAARFYVFEWSGAACVLGAIVLSYTGWWWMHKIRSGLEQRFS